MESWEIILIVVASVFCLFLLYILLAMIFSFGPYRRNIGDEPWEEIEMGEATGMKKRGSSQL